MGHLILCSGYMTSHRTSELEEALEPNLSKPLTSDEETDGKGQ